MIKALRFCYGTTFAFLRGASKQPQKLYLPQKTNPRGFRSRVLGFVFGKNEPLKKNSSSRVCFKGSFFC